MSTPTGNTDHEIGRDHWDCRHFEGPLIVYQNAIRRLCREYGLTRAECVERFGHRLVHVQCNVVTTESVAALTNTQED